MTTPEANAVDVRAAIRMVAEARSDQIRRLIEDVRETDIRRDGRPGGTA